MRPTWSEIEEKAFSTINPFKPGDIVRCLSNQNRRRRLTEGKLYKIIQAYGKNVVITDDTGRLLSGQYWSRFELAIAKELPKFEVKQIEI